MGRNLKNNPPKQSTMIMMIGENCHFLASNLHVYIFDGKYTIFTPPPKKKTSLHVEIY